MRLLLQKPRGARSMLKRRSSLSSCSRTLSSCFGVAATDSTEAAGDDSLAVVADGALPAASSLVDGAAVDCVEVVVVAVAGDTVATCTERWMSAGNNGGSSGTSFKVAWSSGESEIESHEPSGHAATASPAASTLWMALKDTVPQVPP